MIIAAVFYGVKCNRCGDIYEYGDYSYYTDEGIIEEIVCEHGWMAENGRHYCPSCHVFNEETDIGAPKVDFSKELKDLNKFIDSMIQGRRERFVDDKDGSYVVNFSLYRESILQQYQVDYIKNLLGDKLIDISQAETKRRGVTYTIKLKY